MPTFEGHPSKSQVAGGENTHKTEEFAEFDSTSDQKKYDKLERENEDLVEMGRINTFNDRQ